MKYLAYRAHLKELEFLQRQREESVALDNYTNVPMDIEDDDIGSTGQHLLFVQRDVPFILIVRSLLTKGPMK